MSRSLSRSIGALAALAAFTGCGSTDSTPGPNSLGGASALLTQKEASGGTQAVPGSTSGFGGSPSNSAEVSTTRDGVGGASKGSGAPNLLLFSRTLGFRHTSIEPGIDALLKLAQKRGYVLTPTEDATGFTAEHLERFDAVIFLSTTGDVLDAGQQRAFEAFIRSGHGFVGIHAASDTEYDWPWYGGLVGAYFRNHPPVQPARLLIENASHPATQALPMHWSRNDEWYAFRENPRPYVEVLLSLDESTYDTGEASMGEDHPIAWFHEYDGGRAFYTGLGHTDESFQEPEFLEHLAGAIEWAAGK